MNESKQLMEEIVKIADSKKARDIVVLQVDDKTTLTDYFVIMTGTSTPTSAPWATRSSFR